jgi:hypothetical protein
MRFVAALICLGCFLPGTVFAEEPISQRDPFEQFKQFQTRTEQEALDKKLANYEKNKIRQLFVDNLRLALEGGYTNSDNLLTGPGAATNVPREFDSETGFVNVKFGIVDRKIIRDLVLFPNNEIRRKQYLDEDDSQGEWLRWLLLDAVTIDLLGSYGTVLEDAEGSENSKTSYQFVFTAGAKYTLPFDAGSWKNPLDK